MADTTEPVVETPVIETPAVETPAVETEAVVEPTEAETKEETHDDEKPAIQEEVERRHTMATVKENKVAVKEGLLVKQGGNFKSWKKRHFVLLDTSITYFDSPNGKIKGGILMETITGVRVSTPAETKKPNAFTILCGTGRAYIQHAASKEDMDAWVEAIGSVIPEQPVETVVETKEEETPAATEEETTTTTNEDATPVSEESPTTTTTDETTPTTTEETTPTTPEETTEETTTTPPTTETDGADDATAPTTDDTVTTETTEANVQ